MATVVYTLPKYLGLVKAALVSQGLHEIKVFVNRWLPPEKPIIVTNEVPNLFAKPIGLSFKTLEPEPIDKRVKVALEKAFGMHQ